MSEQIRAAVWCALSTAERFALAVGGLRQTR